MHAYDRALFRRALVAIVVLSALAAGVVVATDEATSTAAMRLARLAALSPVMCAVALLGIAAHARVRGELAALEALGTTPWRTLRGAERAGVVFAGVAVLVLATPWSDPTSLLPSVHPLLDFRLALHAARAMAAGVVVDANGAIHLEALRSVGEGVATRSTWAVVPCIAPVALAVPAWAVTPMSATRRALSGLLTSVGVVAALHAVAAGRLTPIVASVACLPVVYASWRARR